MSSGFLSKLKSIKGIWYIVIGLAAGLILLLLPTGTAQKEQNDRTREYGEVLEGSVTELIAALPGVKKCEVMISFCCGYEYTYASDQTVSEKFLQNGDRESYEATKKFFSSDGGALLLREKLPAVDGIAVVCPGASSETQLKIISLLSALFNIGSNRINVSS